jgi:hypothetical protein
VALIKIVGGRMMLVVFHWHEFVLSARAINFANLGQRFSLTATTNVMRE